MKRTTRLAVLLAGMAMLAGCVVAPAPVYREPVYVEPPPPRVEYPGYAPVVGYVWIGGYWTWVGHRYEWVPGRWAPPRPGYRWVAPRWEREGNHWRQHEGRWDRDDRAPRGNPPPPPRYEPPRPAPMPPFRQERVEQPQPPQPLPAPLPRRDMDAPPPGREMNREMRGQPELRPVPPVPHRPEFRRDDHERGERGDGKGRRNRDDDR